MSLRNRKGFSLIELLIVMAIVGILGAVAIPVYDSYKEDAKVAVTKSVLQSAARAIANFEMWRVTTPITESLLGEWVQSGGKNVKGLFYYPRSPPPNEFWCVDFEPFPLPIPPVTSPSTHPIDKEAVKGCIDSTNGVVKDGDCAGRTTCSGAPL